MDLQVSGLLKQQIKTLQERITLQLETIKDLEVQIAGWKKANDEIAKAKRLSEEEISRLKA